MKLGESQAVEIESTSPCSQRMYEAEIVTNSFKDAAYEILETFGRSLHSKEITKLAVKKGRKASYNNAKPETVLGRVRNHHDDATNGVGR